MHNYFFPLCRSYHSARIKIIHVYNISRLALILPGLGIQYTTVAVTYSYCYPCRRAKKQFLELFFTAKSVAPVQSYVEPGLQLDPSSIQIEFEYWDQVSRKPGSIYADSVRRGAPAAGQQACA